MVKALHFITDGVANAIAITAAFQERAASNGAVFREAKVLNVVTSEGAVTGVETKSALIPCQRVILATGVWTSQLVTASGVQLPPVAPVAHPYVHGPQRQVRDLSMPFVRLPEYQVYLRDHGQFDGLGSYAHEPLPVDGGVSQTAIGEWNTTFSKTLDAAYDRLEQGSLFARGKAFNGIFSVTPDNFPIVGPVSSTRGLWVCAAVWVTHAAACTRTLADMVVGRDEVLKLWTP